MADFIPVSVGTAGRAACSNGNASAAFAHPAVFITAGARPLRETDLPGGRAVGEAESKEVVTCRTDGTERRRAQRAKPNQDRALLGQEVTGQGGGLRRHPVVFWQAAADSGQILL
jgi:hypothetical protein